MTLDGEPASNRGFKLRLYPTDEQKKKMLQNMQASRIAYNYAVATNLKEYEEWDKVKSAYRTSLEEKELSKEEIKKEMEKFNKSNIKNYISSDRSLSKKFNNEERKEKAELAWLKECDSFSFTYTFGYNFKSGIDKFNSNYEVNKRNIDNKKKRGNNKIYSYPKDYGFPRFKKYKEATSYPTVIKVEHLDIDNKRVFVPKIGWVKFAPNQKIPAFMYPSKSLGKPVISTNGRDFFLSFGYYGAFQELNNEKTDIIGIDLGVANIATLNTGETVINFADDEKVKKYEESIVKLNKRLSKLIDKGKSEVFRSYILTKEEKENTAKDKRSEKCTKLSKERYKLSTNQERKIRKAIKNLQIKINNRKDNLLNEACHKIVEKNPAGIIFEDLNVKGMQKNKKLSPKLQKTGMSKFKTTLIWHAKKHKIPCREVSRWYASSQICSSCGEVNEEMKDLSKRVYKCPKCGMILDRDVNAGINLRKMWNSKNVKPCVGSIEEDKEYIKSISK